jgi:hypothetical protein
MSAAEPPIKKNIPFGGNIVNSSNSNAMRYSQLVRINGGRNGTSTLISNPNASTLTTIVPPRNTF